MGPIKEQSEIILPARIQALANQTFGAQPTRFTSLFREYLVPNHLSCRIFGFICTERHCIHSRRKQAHKIAVASA